MVSPEADNADLNRVGLSLRQLTTHGASVSVLTGDGCFRLEIPAGPAGNYRLAQIFDTQGLSRRDFLWRVPFTLRLKARVSSPGLPGTWGFGLWNDPFSVSLGVKGGARKLPALPNAAWFFNASAENHLTLRDDLPGSGFLTAVFSSPKTPGLFLTPALIGLPLLALKATARLIRRTARHWIKEDSTALNGDRTQWHAYEIEADEGGVRFDIDGETAFSTKVVPRGRLGLVIWIDNQYAAFTTQGRLGYGTLASSNPAWLEIEGLEISNTL